MKDKDTELLAEAYGQIRGYDNWLSGPAANEGDRLSDRYNQDDILQGGEIQVELANGNMYPLELIQKNPNVLKNSPADVIYVSFTPREVEEAFSAHADVSDAPISNVKEIEDIVWKLADQVLEKM